MNMLVTFDVNQHLITLRVVTTVRHARFVVDMNALLVKQVIATYWASPLLSLCSPIELRVNDGVGFTVLGSACRPVGVQCWIVGRGAASHLDVTGDFGGGETEQVVVSPLAASVTCSGGEDPAIAPNPPEVAGDDPSHPLIGMSPFRPADKRMHEVVVEVGAYLLADHVFVVGRPAAPDRGQVLHDPRGRNVWVVMQPRLDCSQLGLYLFLLRFD